LSFYPSDPIMIRQPATTSRPRAARHAVSRQLVLMGVLGTFVPLAVLAVLYLLAPAPLTEATAQTLRLTNRFAGAVVLVNAALTLAAGAGSRIAQAVSARRSLWQPVRLVRQTA
jgi:hypothetical protein